MQSVDNEKRYSQEGDIALAKALQRYLPYLEALSQATTSNLLPRMKHGRPPSEVTLSLLCDLGCVCYLLCWFSLGAHTGNAS